MSSLACLAEFGERITKLFASHIINEQGAYGVIVCKNGTRQLIIVDDYLPCKNGKPCFSRSNGEELWVLILEKAWAKVHGSYERIESGMTYLTVRDLTGSPGNVYNIENTENLYEIML